MMSYGGGTNFRWRRCCTAVLLKKKSSLSLSFIHNSTKNSNNAFMNQVANYSTGCRSIHRWRSATSTTSLTSTVKGEERKEERGQRMMIGRGIYENDIPRQIITSRLISTSPRGKPIVSTMKVQRKQKRAPKFVSFFEEVDAKMGINPRKHHRRERDAFPSTFSKKGNQERSNYNDVENNRNELHRKKIDEHQGSDMSYETRGQKKQHSFSSSLSSSNKSNNRPKSIFDVLASVNAEDSNNDDISKHYEKDAFEEYKEVMESLIQNKKFQNALRKQCKGEKEQAQILEWLLNEKPLVNYNFTGLDEAMENGISMPNVIQEENDGEKTSKTKKFRRRRMELRPDVFIPDSQANKFHQEVMKQRDHFMEESNFTKEQYNVALHTFGAFGQNCARLVHSTPLLVAWEKIKEAGMILDSEMMSTFMYVAGTGFLSSSLNKQSSSLGSTNNSELGVLSILGNIGETTDSDDNDDGNKDDRNNSDLNDDPAVDFPTELATFHDLLLQPTEKSMTVRVKYLVANGDGKKAESLLDSFPSNDGAKLRSYLPVLKLYCDQGDVNAALRLFKRMCDEPKVLLEPENHVLLIATLGDNGYFRNDSKVVEAATEMGYSKAYGPELFDSLVADMAEDVLEISSASARRLYNALVQCYSEEKTSSKLEPLRVLSGLKPVNTLAELDELVASRVNVGKTTGICPRTNVKLPLIKLKKEEREQLHNSLLELSTSRFQTFSRGENQDANYAAKELESFAQWLDERDGNPFTAIIDGANIAYYMQNFEEGSFSYPQIQFMVDELEKMGENPLVIIPYKYSREKFAVNMGASRRKFQLMSNVDKDIMSKLRQSGKMYVVPPMCLDDYYWMIASVSDQTRSRNGTDLDVPPNNKEGRLPGTRPMLISNDQMRDHKLGMLEPRLFRRWHSCYIVNYNYGAFMGTKSLDKEIGFTSADFFSREIQGSQTESGLAWHFPVRDWGLNERFCIRIPR